MIRGIDVSHHQKPERVDYEELKAQGFEFVYIRATYGVTPDEAFRKHFEKAWAAGLKVGAYAFFRQTKDVALQYAAMRAQLESVNYGPGDLLPVVDLEWNASADGPIVPNQFALSEKFLSKLKSEFGGAVAYLAPGFFETLGKPKWLLDYPWWISHYTRKGTPWCPFKEWDIWQWSGTGKVTAFDGPIDLNYANRLAECTVSPWESLRKLSKP